MVTVKNAAEKANAYLIDLLGPRESVRLEEVESNGEAWAITLSYLVAPSKGELLSMRLAEKREYKVFNIDKNTGEVTSMKIRHVQDA